MIRGIGYAKPAIISAIKVLRDKKFIRKIACNGQIPVYWISKHDPQVEAMVFSKGEQYLVDNSAVLKNLGIRPVIKAYRFGGSDD